MYVEVKSEYKKGDRVVCTYVPDYGNGNDIVRDKVTIGKVYTIVKSYKGVVIGGTVSGIYVKNDIGIISEYNPYFFANIRNYLIDIFGNDGKDVNSIPESFYSFNYMNILRKYEKEYSIWGSDRLFNVGRWEIFLKDFQAGVLL